MFQSRFNHHPYSLGVFFGFSLLSSSPSSRVDIVGQTLPGQMSCQKICPNPCQTERYIVICLINIIELSYIYLFIYVSSIVGNQVRYRFELSFAEGLTFFPPPRLVDEVRDALEDDDSEASHIELAQEIIKSHADWNGSSSDSDLWDKITEASHSLAGRSLRVLIRSEVESPEMA